ncbi:MAG TPA: hypothetical protein VJ984_10600 [Xanthomonadales bacterium]|nr:hypothetical protein [Xanthomonadales bacterium]
MRIDLLLAVCLLTVFFPAAADQGDTPGHEQLDFFIGAWNLESESLQQDGSYVTNLARSDVYQSLDGAAIQDDFRLLAEDGQVVFRGTSFRTYVPRTGKWAIKWMMAGEPGMTDITATWTGEELLMEGQGYDGMGEFLEKARYFDITDESYEFVLSRSYDDGETWIENMNRIHATRISSMGSRVYPPRP